MYTDTELVHWEWNADKVPTHSPKAEEAPKKKLKQQGGAGDALGGSDAMQFDKSNIIMFGPTGSGVCGCCMFCITCTGVRTYPV